MRADVESHSWKVSVLDCFITLMLMVMVVMEEVEEEVVVVEEVVRALVGDSRMRGERDSG